MFLFVGNDLTILCVDIHFFDIHFYSVMIIVFLPFILSQIIHWWMEMTKDEPFFSDVESDDDDDDENDNGDRGAIYSGFDGLATHLFDPADFRVGTSGSFDTTGLSDEILPDGAIDLIRNAIDDRDEAGRHNDKWCLYDGLNSDAYFEAVFILALGGFKKVSLDDEDWRIYQQRQRTNWAGADSLYDALLLIEGKPREAFNMAGFLEKYEDWEALRKAR